MIDKVLDEVISKMKMGNVEADRYVKVLLEKMEYDVPYSSTEILALLGLKSKETLRKNYLDPAMEAGFVRMTIPDRPKSKNQRYVKT